MNANMIFASNRLCLAAAVFGLALALPAMAQQADMPDMQMPAQSSSAPAPASSAQSMQGMGMSSMPDMQMPQPAQPSSAPAPASSSDQAMQGMDMSSMPDTQAPPKPAPKHAKHKANQPKASPAPASSAQAMHGMNMSSMQGMPMPMQPSQPTEMQHLHFGNMIGTRPKPGGLAQGMQGMSMPSMQGMDTSSMQGGQAPPGARRPDYSDGYRYTDMPGMAMSDHARESMLLLDQLEYVHDNHGGNAAAIDGQFWYGEDFNKLWLKFEGERAGGRLQDMRTEALWDHAIGIYWDTQMGVRHDFGEGPGRTWAAFGVEGLAPYWFETEATFYVGQGGRTAARVQAEYEVLFTQRLILQPKLEANFYGKDDPARDIGSGLSDIEAGLRLRYEIRREFAPYIGIVWRQRLGRTADFARAQGEHADDLQFVAGLRIWF